MAFAITTPIVAITMWVLEKNTSLKDVKFPPALVVSSCISMVILDVPLLVSLFVDLSIQLFVILVGVLQAAFVVYMVRSAKQS